MFRKSHKLSDQQIDEIVSSYRKGESSLAIAARLGVKPQTVRYHLIQLDVERRSYSDARREHPLNENAFEYITEESAYWIGFLMADGNVHELKSRSTGISLEISDIDEEHLYRFRSFLGSSHQVTRRRGMVAIAVYSNKIAADLARYGVVPRKSRSAQVIGLENDRHFWRGVVDGDGTLCASKGQIQIHLAGSQMLVQQFLDFAKTIVPTTWASTHPFGNIYRVGFGASVGAKILRVLYGECMIALERKHNLALQMIAQADR